MIHVLAHILVPTTTDQLWSRRKYWYDLVKEWEFSMFGIKDNHGYVNLANVTTDLMASLLPLTSRSILHT